MQKKEKKEGGWVVKGEGGRTRTRHNGELCTEDETPWETKGGDITGCGSSACLGDSQARGSRDTDDSRSLTLSANNSIKD